LPSAAVTSAPVTTAPRTVALRGGGVARVSAPNPTSANTTHSGGRLAPVSAVAGSTATVTAMANPTDQRPYRRGSTTQPATPTSQAA
jgi:hypothetical protein